ncbi:hypothetical protein BWI93_06015 [Siphonobacter sp. BAB-5385]|uniref:M56 family metallopeptidase n=1 Tax=Siphonobacter sp. BAB-5385 TaxID=1864822 RepID=UPI000B9EA8B6|nr:M56 family metallopeptidase [Siphonobacter sp. BAB-5385]OZI09058.1 hypothetical protein BWI93_06015 [Siphonobacter sp. BAB-5385]
MTYLLHASLILSSFYAVYWFGLRKLTFHTLKRFYLLGTLVCSLLIPVLPILPAEVVREESIWETTPVVSPSEPGAQPIAESKPNTETSAIDWNFIGFSVYAGVAGTLSLLLIARVFVIIHQIQRKPRTTWHCLRIIPTEQTTASFFRWVFLNEADLTDSEREMVLIHEYVHYRRLHSLDLLLVELLGCVWWFNPALYWLKKSLVQTHEYEVDAELATRYGAKPYAQLLLKLAIPGVKSLRHTFARQPIKSRIKMLFTPSSAAMKKILFVLVLPLMAVSVVLFAQRIPAQEVRPDPVGSERTSLPVASAQATGSVKLAPVAPGKPLSRQRKIKKERPIQLPPRTLTDGYQLGKNPIVFINGKRYDASILERIDPEKLRTAALTPKGKTIKFEGKEVKDGKIELTVHDDFELTDTRKIRIAATNARDTYRALTNASPNRSIVRVRQTSYEENPYEVVYYLSPRGASAAVSLKPGERVEFYLDGVKRTEEQMNAAGRQGTSRTAIEPQNGVARIEINNKN